MAFLASLRRLIPIYCRIEIIRYGNNHTLGYTIVFTEEEQQEYLYLYRLPTCEHGHSSSFACSVVTQEGGDLTLVHVDGQVGHGHLLRTSTDEYLKNV